MEIKTISEKLSLYARLYQEIREWTRNNFRVGSKVKVNCERFNGFGVVDFMGSDVPTGMVPVKLENGNAWYYSVLDCKCV